MEGIRHLKRTVARSSRARRTRQVNTPRVRRAFVENFSDAPHAQDTLSKLLTALSAIVHIFGKGAGARGGDGGERAKQQQVNTPRVC